MHQDTFARKKDDYIPTKHSPRHIHVPILPMSRGLPHLHLELRARVPAVHRQPAPRREAVGPVDDGLLLLVAGAVWRRRGLGVRRRRSRRAATLFALEPGPRRGRLRLDLLKGRGLGDDVLEELEVVVVRDGVGWGGGLVGGREGGWDGGGVTDVFVLDVAAGLALGFGHVLSLGHEVLDEEFLGEGGGGELGFLDGG